MSQHILTNVQYNESKQEVLVEFSYDALKVVERIPFFPYLNFSTKLSRDNLQEILFSFGLKKFKILDSNNSDNENKKIIASSFSELKKISIVIAKAFGKKPLILEPERQFLLEKNWSYFDCFKNNEKIDESCDFGFLLTKLIPFEDAIELAENETLSLVEKATLSKILSVNISNLPKKKEDIVETFLENIFFKSGISISFKEKNDFYLIHEFAPLGFYENISKIDFSLVWIQLFTKKFFNIGFETKNCSCCQPIILDDVNLYPDSMIEIVFLEDMIFYESTSKSFAKKFHEQNPGKEWREKKKKEFFMRAYPIGPFFKNQNCMVPINDAQFLLSEKKVSLGKKHELSWFCKKNESFLSKEIIKINSRLFEISKKIDSQIITLEKNIDFNFYFNKYELENFGKIISEIPFQLLNLNSKFFSSELANVIKFVQEATIYKFREFSEKNGYRVLHANSHSAFIKGYSSLKLVKSFSKELSFPQPKILAFSQSSKLV
jgi:hypothetical protein